MSTTVKKYRKHPLPCLGDRFGSLSITSIDAGRDSRGRRLVSAQCDCGEVTVARWDHIQSGNTTSCECVKIRLYDAYRAMLSEAIPIGLCTRLWADRCTGLPEKWMEVPDQRFEASNKALAKVYAAELDAITLPIGKPFPRGRNRCLGIQQAHRRVEQMIHRVLGMGLFRALRIMEEEKGLGDDARAEYAFAFTDPLHHAKNDPKFGRMAVLFDETTGHYRRVVVERKVTFALWIAARVKTKLRFLHNTPDELGKRVMLTAIALLSRANLARLSYGLEALSMQTAFTEFAHAEDEMQDSRDTLSLLRSIMDVRWAPALPPQREGLVLNSDDFIDAPELLDKFTKFTTAPGPAPEVPKPAQKQQHDPELTRLFYNDYQGYLARIAPPPIALEDQPF